MDIKCNYVLQLHQQIYSSDSWNRQSASLGFWRRHTAAPVTQIAADLCPDSKRGEDQLPALLVPAERGEVLFIKERYLVGIWV
jgi:hypothetical protein